MKEGDNLLNYNDLIGLMATLYILVFALLVITKSNRTSKVKRIDNEFLKILTLSIKEGSIESLADLYNIYDGLLPVSRSEISEESHRKYLRRMLNKVSVELRLRVEDREEFMVMQGRIKYFISLIDQVSPFDSLPEVERNLLNDLQYYVTKKEDNGALRKIDEISSAIIIRNEQLKKAHNINFITVPLSIVSLIVTVYFGIISINN